MSALADRLGVRPPSLYNHIASLDDLYSQLTIKGLAELTRTVEEALAANQDSGPSRAIAVATRQFAKDHPTLFHYSTHGMHLSKPDRKRYGGRLMKITSDAYLETVGPAKKGEAAQYLMRCLVYGFITLEINGALEPAKNLDKLYDNLIDIADAGIRNLASK
jgi:AcrR family transcriptional regulator